LPTDRSDPASQARRNRVVGITCALAFGGMVGAAYASVPLYKAFCQLTGFDGTVRKASAAPSTTLEKTLLIRFDTNVRDLPWTFTSEQVSQTVKIGETGLAYFKVTNDSDKPITGRAVYNVVPEQAGPFFQKLECFCFSDQTIAPHATVEFPVVYFVDPKYATDFETRNKGEVTLSYTFYRAVDTKPAKTASSGLGGTARPGL
jgi:cytochrome c oxidase assembly protein subunit 11